MKRVLRWFMYLIIVAFACLFAYRSYQLITNPCTELVYPEIRKVIGIKPPPANCPKQVINDEFPNEQ